MKRLSLVLLIFMLACASLPLKERAAVGLNTSEIALEASHDAERKFCAPAADQTKAITHCDGLAASAIGLTDARHQALASLYSKAFAGQVIAAQALMAWRAGDPAPSSLVQYQADILEIVAQVTALWPASHAVVTKAQEASTDAATSAKTVGGGK